jgi:hypothetical protein
VFRVYYFYSHTTREWHHKFQKNVLWQGWDWIPDNKLGARNSDKADMEDDHMKEQAPFPSYQGVNKQGWLTGQSDMGVHDYNIVDNSELLPTLPRRVKVKITNGWAKSNICQFTRDMHPIKILYSIRHFHVVFSQLFFCIVGWWDQLILPIVFVHRLPSW